MTTSSSNRTRSPAAEAAEGPVGSPEPIGPPPQEIPEGSSRCGGTPLVLSRVLGSRYGVHPLYFKLERTNPTGTHKDRAAEAIAREARATGARGLTIGTCGNFGAALARAARPLGLPCRLYVPSHYHAPGLTGTSPHVTTIRVPGLYEDAVAASQDWARESGWFDANPTGAGGEVSIRAYARIAHEILDELQTPPRTVWICVGNGTTLVGLDQGFRQRGVRPRLGACGSVGNTAVTASIRAGREIILDRDTLHETAVNEPLLNFRSAHARAALEAVRGSGGTAHDATDDELESAAEELRVHEEIATHPASAAALCGLLRTREHMLETSGPHVVILTA